MLHDEKDITKIVFIFRQPIFWVVAMETRWKIMFPEKKNPGNMSFLKIDFSPFPELFSNQFYPSKKT